MAKRPGKHGEKSAAVRKILEANPKIKVATIVEQLEAQGISVSRNQVYMIKSKGRRRGRKAKVVAAAEAGRVAGIVSPVAAVTKVRSLAIELGGMKNLKQLVDLLAG